MKNTMMKVWGVVLTLAILAGLLVAAVPVSAANLAWTANTVPATTNNFLLPAAATGWKYAASDDGSLILAYETASNRLYQSVDGGATFKDLGVALLPAGITDMAISPDNTTVVATTGAALFGSTNAGAAWANIALPAGFGTVLSLDVIAGPQIAIGSNTGNYAVYGVAGGPFSGGWASYNTWQNAALAGNPIIGIAFSPNYAGDQTIVLVYNDGVDTYVSFAWSDQPVGITYADKQILADTSANACIAFPADFNMANGNLLVGLDNKGLWKVGVSAFAPAPVAVPVTSNIYNTAGVTSLSFVGTYAAGTAYFTDATDVKRITGVSASSVTVANSTNVTGTNPLVSATEGKVVVLTDGAVGALNLSTDGGATFIQTNLIAGGLAIDNVTLVDANNILIVANGNSIFKSTDAGKTWQRIQYSATGTYVKIYASPAFATDNTFYLATTGNMAWKTTDGGKTLTPFVVAGPIDDMAVVDANTYYYAATGNIYKSTNLYTALTGAAGVVSICYVDPVTIYAGTNAGGVLKSEDGTTFKAVVGATGFTGNVVVAATTKTAYAASDVAGEGVKVYRNSAWVAAGAGLPGTETIAALTLNADGTLYAVDTANAVVYRNADGANFEDTACTIAAPFASKVLGTTIYVNDGAGMANFTDTLSAAPAFTSPGTGAEAILDSGNATLSWAAVPGALSYEWKISSTANMTSGLMLTVPGVTTTSVFLPNEPITLVNGQTYYVTVQVDAPYKSKVSEVTTFQTKLNTLGTSLVVKAPLAGANIASSSPTFAWDAVANADSYEFKMSDKPDFSTTIDSSIGLTSTVYNTNVTLTEGTYYWQVRAVKGTNFSDWVQSTFNIVAASTGPQPTGGAITVMPPVVTIEPAEVTVNVPTPTTPTSTSTPAWVWVIIAIGAVLVIAVIVLIVRTRRV